jgi:hypothetical protein
MLIAVAALAVLGVAGFVFLAGSPDPQVEIARPASPTQLAQTTAPPTPASPPTPVAVEPPRPAGPSAADRSKPNRLARDLEREQIWSALGRKHSLRPAAPGSAAPSEAAAELLPTLDKNYVRESIKEQLVPVAVDCYNTVLQGDSSLGGSLVFNFTIIGDEEIGGVVEAVEIGEESTFDSEFLRECLSESLLAVTFPPPPGGGRVEVSYPMHFEPE